MCAARSPFERMIANSDDDPATPLDHDLLAKVVSELDYLCFFDVLGAHNPSGPLSRGRLTDQLFERTNDLCRVVRKPIEARISIFDGIAVPRAKTILPVQPYPIDPLSVAPGWMKDLPGIKEIGVAAHRVEAEEIEELRIPCGDLLSRTEPLAINDLAAMARNDFGSMASAIFMGQRRIPGSEDDGPPPWRFLHQSHRLKLFGPIDLTNADMSARSCAYAGRPLMETVNRIERTRRPAAYAFGGTICGEVVMGSGIAVPLVAEQPEDPQIVLLIRDLVPSA